MHDERVRRDYYKEEAEALQFGIRLVKRVMEEDVKFRHAIWDRIQKEIDAEDKKKKEQDNANAKI